jgi:nucleosome binding factor SPN SPT16 subunit
LYIRPTLGGRRSTGTLELHKNGFRFRSSKGGNVDIMFKNIKHAFFQPAENEVITIIHFHLWHPIMVGKKKTSVRCISFHTTRRATRNTTRHGTI